MRSDETNIGMVAKAVRICEDAGLTTHKISNSGIAVWREFVQNIKGNYQDLLDVAFKDLRTFTPACSSLPFLTGLGRATVYCMTFWRESSSASTPSTSAKSTAAHPARADSWQCARNVLRVR